MSITTGRVYRIICLPNPNIQYVGSTFNELRHRWQNHIKLYKYYIYCKENPRSLYKHFDKYGIDNFQIVLIKEYQIYREHNKDRKHLSVYEQLWINKIKCCNINSAFSIKWLSIKVYRKNNKENIKQWKNNNKEIVNAYHKKYREDNKEHIRTNSKKTYICPCSNKPLTISNKSYHEKTKKHIRYLEKNQK